MNRSKQRPTALLSVFPFKANFAARFGSSRGSTTTGDFEKKSPTAMVKKYLPLVVFAAAVILVGTFAVNTFRGYLAAQQKTDDRITIPGAKKFVAINKEFSFAVKDANGKEATKMKYNIASAELRDEVIIQGKRQVPVKGKTFLVLSVKLTNSYTNDISFYSKDYIRLTKNGNDSELLSADIHNDPISVASISTKESRLGYLISDDDKNLKLHVGDDKKFDTIVPIVFK